MAGPVIATLDPWSWAGTVLAVIFGLWLVGLWVSTVSSAVREGRLSPGRLHKLLRRRSGASTPFDLMPVRLLRRTPWVHPWAALAIVVGTVVLGVFELAVGQDAAGSAVIGIPLIWGFVHLRRGWRSPSRPDEEWKF